jgi:hypothetical protein
MSMLSQLTSLPAAPNIDFETATRAQLEKLSFEEAYAIQIRSNTVTLDSPDANPPFDKIGHWSDGKRVVAVAVTKAGRRLFIDVQGDVVTTNVNSYLIDPYDG